MEKNNITIEERLKNMRKLYMKLDKIIDEIPDEIPDKVKQSIKEKIMGDKELKELMDGIGKERPPRFLLIGRTGVGKSSLVNALCGAYVAKVSDVESCTIGTTFYECKDNGRTLMEIMDSRGIAESDRLDDSRTAEEQLIDEIKDFTPDVVIFMLSSVHRDSIDKDVDFLKKLRKKYYDKNLVDLPIVTVINKTDEVSPSRINDPKLYTENKLFAIKKIQESYQKIIAKNGLKINGIISVSSCIDWMTEEGEEVSAEQINGMIQSEIDKLEIAFDGRYKIEELRTLLIESIEDYEAKMGLRMALKLEELVRNIAKQLKKIFASIATVIATTPIPISDIYILLILQAILVVSIAALSGREISIQTAKEFIIGLGGIGGAGLGFRLAAQQATKLLNTTVPGAGSVISAIIAGSGTSAIGSAAISYYIDDKDIEKVKDSLKKNKIVENYV